MTKSSERSSTLAVALGSLPYDPMLAFGQHLAQLRREQGISQEALALESGLARSYLGGVERGQRNLALVNICRLAHALGVPPSELLDFEPLMHGSRRRGDRR